VTDGDAVRALAGGFDGTRRPRQLRRHHLARRGDGAASFFQKRGRRQPVRHVPYRRGLPCTRWQAKKGVIVNVASMYARFGSPRNPAYGASKAAVEQLTKSLAIAWAPDGIRVNALAPGFIVTEQSARSRTDPQHVANVNARTPLGRWGQPDDIAGTALFLASSAAGFITGACIPIDGGYSVV
jgi:NAD(P)-dependent dehydrogenase (short-subunit alcohol dehydrogenase family)